MERVRATLASERTSMRAVIQAAYGPPAVLELRDVAMPTLGDDEVLVRVRAASVHPDVWHVVSGRPYIIRLLAAGLRTPKQPIPGTDMAGTIEAVGKHVTRFRPGDAVFGETVGFHTWCNGGAFAEFVRVRPEWLASKPANVTFEQAAAVPTAWYIVLLNLRHPDQIRAGQRVLVNGAGGGVGSLALQLAKAQGAHVTAVDAPGKMDLLRHLGADRVIDYTQEDFTHGSARYDLIFDVPGNRPFSACRRVLDPNGRYVLIGHEAFGAAGKRFFGILPSFFRLMFLARFVRQLRGPRHIAPPSRASAMALLADLLESGKITPVIDSAFALEETPDALRRLMEEDVRGRVVVTP